MVEVKTHDGKKMVDTSDEACLKYGFRSGDVIETCFGEVAIVAGVAEVVSGRNAGKNALWYTKDDGFSYYYCPGNLKEFGFKLKTKY